MAFRPYVKVGTYWFCKSTTAWRWKMDTLEVSSHQMPITRIAGPDWIQSQHKHTRGRKFTWYEWREISGAKFSCEFWALPSSVTDRKVPGIQYIFQKTTIIQLQICTFGHVRVFVATGCIWSDTLSLPLPLETSNLIPSYFPAPLPLYLHSSWPSPTQSQSFLLVSQLSYYSPLPLIADAIGCLHSQ